MQFTLVSALALMATIASAAPSSNALFTRNYCAIPSCPAVTEGTQCQVRTDPQWTGGNGSSCCKGNQEASTYTAVSGAGCGIDFDDSSEMVAAYYMDLDANPNQPNPHCGKTLDITNPWTGKTITVKVVDTCPTCSGVGSGITGEWANFNGATIDLNALAFSTLFGGQTTGVFDVCYTPL